MGEVPPPAGHNLTRTRCQSMICISVSPDSFPAAQSDLAAAARTADVIELCLDRLNGPVDFQELIRGAGKPVLVSCRRADAGGRFAGAESDRVALLREAAAAEPDFLELQPDLLFSVPRKERTRLVLSFCNPSGPVDDVAGCLDRAEEVQAAAVRFIWPAPSTEEILPILPALAHGGGGVPVELLGLGRAAVAASLLAQRHGAPWISAALERGRETYDGQAAADELRKVYGCRRVDASTRFIGVVGGGTSALKAIRAVNGGMEHLGINISCLPLELRGRSGLPALLDKLDIPAVLSTRHPDEQLWGFADDEEHDARVGRNVDLLVRRNGIWHAFNTISRTAVRAVEKPFEQRDPAAALEGRTALVFGSGPLAQTMLFGLQRKKALIGIADAFEPGEEGETGESWNSSAGSVSYSSQQLAQLYNVRFVPFAEVAGESPEIAVFADARLAVGTGERQLNPAFLQPSMTVVDVACMPEDSELVRAARDRGCRVVEPAAVFGRQLSLQFKLITGKILKASALKHL